MTTTLLATPDPEPSPGTFTIPICPDCGALPGDIHTCVTDAVEVAAALATPITWILGGAW